MKLISFTVPSYNSENYLNKCVDSLLKGGDDVEIIIVNDGSRDGTLAIAREYEQKYPDIVRVVDKENGGHGSGVNAGQKIATGLYFKVVDSDDWVDEDALAELLRTIKQHMADGTLPDLYVTDFVYFHAADNTNHVSSYETKFPVRQLCSWDNVKKFKYSHLLLMHAVMFKLDKLLESNTVLPEHTFYVDNYFAYKPLPFMKTVYYLDVHLYQYYIGRDDQSVNRANFVKRYAQQLRVMRCMVDAYKWREIKAMPKGLRNYLWHMLEAVMMNTIFFTCAEDSKERREGLKELWRHIKSHDRQLYRKLRSNSYATVVNYLPWRLRGRVMSFGYNVLCKKVKLG